LETLKKFKTWIISTAGLLSAIGVFYWAFGAVTADFVRVGQAANAQEDTDRRIQHVQTQSTENKADLLYIHKRGTRRELKQAEEELYILRDFDGRQLEKSKLLNEIADLETELEDYTQKIEALKSPP